MLTVNVWAFTVSDSEVQVSGGRIEGYEQGRWCETSDYELVTFYCGDWQLNKFLLEDSSVGMWQMHLYHSM